MQGVLRQQQRRSRPQPLRAAGEAGGSAAAQSGAPPPAWDLAQRISGDAAAMLMTGEPFTAELILRKGERAPVWDSTWTIVTLGYRAQLPIKAAARRCFSLL